jgi:hypothetical protein
MILVVLKSANSAEAVIVFGVVITDDVTKIVHTWASVGTEVG